MGVPYIYIYIYIYDISRLRVNQSRCPKRLTKVYGKCGDKNHVFSIIIGLI